MRDTVWVTRDGRMITVSKMETQHIINCIHLIEDSVAEGKPWRVRYLERLRLELTIRELN